MTNATLLTSPSSIRTAARKITHRTRGRRHGAITRLMSPGDLGEVLKPFVFLDLFDTGNTSLGGMGLHPHSGIATVTHLFEGSVRYEDTTGATGVLPDGGVEWFKAGHGAWHGGGAGDSGRTRGFQLWVALPPEHELGPVESIYQAPGEIKRDGPARVLIGNHRGISSALDAPSSLNYLAVRLRKGDAWRYEPAAGHTVGWVAVGKGTVLTPAIVEAGELVAFAPAAEPIDFYAEDDAEFVLGSAAPHAHNLVLGYYSVHTSAAALQAGEQNISEIGHRLQKEGRLSI